MNIILCTLIPNGEENPFDQIDPNLLSEAEHERVARFVFPRDRWSYAAAHALLRLLLTEVHGLPPLSWRFSNNEFGRPEIHPEIMTDQAVRFNISHTHGMAVCALTGGNVPEGVEIGVDAEYLQRDHSSQSLADRFFSNREAQWLRSLPDQQRRYEFIRLWTLKEAVAKAVGRGLQLDLKSFHCDVTSPSVSFDMAEWGPSDTWELHNWNAAPHHTVSLAVRRPPGTDITLEVRHLAGKLHSE